LQFTTDSGPAFKNALIEGLLSRLGTDHVLTTAYSKEQNALVERANKEVLRHLRNIIFDKRVAAKWSKYLPLVQRIINTSVNTSTGVTPADIVFPNGMKLDNKSIVSTDQKISISNYIKDLQIAQANIIETATQSLKAHDDKHMLSKSHIKPNEYKEGDLVLVEYRHNSLRRGPKSKLQPFLKGPMRVLMPTKLGNYKLQELNSLETREYHVAHMRPFIHDERCIDPLKVAVADSLDEFVVERVIDMRGDVSKRSTLEFKIRWAGYNATDDTWESWKDCRDAIAVQNFLVSHPDKKVQRLAKKEFQNAQQQPTSQSLNDEVSESEQSEDLDN